MAEEPGAALSGTAQQHSARTVHENDERVARANLHRVALGELRERVVVAVEAHLAA